VDTVGPVEDGSKKVGRPNDIFEGQLKEKCFAGFALGESVADGSIVGGAVLDGVIEDGRVGSQPGHRELIDVALESSFVQQIAGDVIQPETLAQVVKKFSCFHFCVWF